MNGLINKGFAEQALSPMQAKTRDILVQRKKHLEEQLADVNKAIDLLDKHPELEEYQDVMRRVI